MPLQKLLPVLFACCCLHVCYAQPGELDLSFDPNVSANAPIYAVAIQSDGKIIIGGWFDAFDGVAINRLARLNTDGSLDTTFHIGSGFSGLYVNTLAIQTDGKIIAGGWFSDYNGVPANFICRVNSDGSPDTTFHSGTGFNDNVKSLCIQPDGKILVGGLFTSYNGIACKYLARLNTDGSYDTIFNTGIHGANGSVEAIAIDSFGRIVIGGDFTVYDTLYLPLYGNNVFRITRVHPDGSRDTSFVPKLGPQAAVFDLDLMPDFSIIIGGNFTSLNFQPWGRFAVLSGSADPFFHDGPGANSSVYDVQYLSNGNILAAGNFTSYNGEAINRIVTLKRDGKIDSTFNPGTGANNDIYAMTLQTDGKIIIVGNFTDYNGMTRNRIARLYNCRIAQPNPITGNDSTLCS